MVYKLNFLLPHSLSNVISSMLETHGMLQVN